MERKLDFNEISDGRKYTANDMVKADCNDCKGCSECCSGMGESITLDPLDVSRLTEVTEMDFNKLMLSHVDLNVVEGIILPNLRMDKLTDKCTFLNVDGRCSIHGMRPGICRLFPLGRIYENGGFRYFIQVHECANQNRTKVKVKKWIGMSRIGAYERFVTDWHYFLKDVTKSLIDYDESSLKNVSMYILNNFYIRAYKKDQDFYEQFAERLESAKNDLGV